MSMNTAICFLLFLSVYTLSLSLYTHSVQETTIIYVSNYRVSTAGVVEKKRFGETASIYFKASNAREYLK